MGAAIAQWICLRLPSCGPRFESQAHHLCFYHLYSNFVLHLSLCQEKNDSKQKEAHLKEEYLKVPQSIPFWLNFNSV